MEIALQQQTLGLQLKQIEAQNRLANAEATKTIAEANKIAGVDTEGAKLENEWKKVENRIQLSLGIVVVVLLPPDWFLVRLVELHLLLLCLPLVLLRFRT